MTDPRSAEFDRYLAKGLGRAHLMLERGADEALCAALLAACLNRSAVGDELGGSRAPYLLELVRLAEITTALATALTEPFKGDPNESDVEQRFELIGLLARDGVPGMRETLYRGNEQLMDRWLAERPSAPPSDEPARQLIALDGLSGAIFAFGQLGRAALADDEFRDGDALVGEARNALDGSEADARLADARAADPRVDAYLRAVERHTARLEEDTRQLPTRRWDVPWTEARVTIEGALHGTSRSTYFAMKWGEEAPDEELAVAARALVDLPHTDPERLRAYLAVFARHAFPLDPEPLVALLDDPRDKVAWFAANALERLRHPAVRAAGLRIAHDGPIRQRALDLLARNWEPGDERIAERLLRAEEELDAVHAVCLGLHDVVEIQLSGDLVPALLLAYEQSPCSLCREDFVAALVRLGALPDELRRECRWDANEEIRKLVSSDA